MHILQQLLLSESRLTQVLSLLQLAFTIWMMVDAYHRGVEVYWYWIILFFQPIGAWVYFFAVKLPTFRRRSTVRWNFSGQGRQSLDQLRYAVARAPTIANRIALAQRLMEKGEHGEAIPLLETVHAVEPDFLLVLHALAECRLATNHAEQAVAPLERLIQRDPRWGDYRAWRTLIQVHQSRGQPADVLATCREFTKRVPTLENKCQLAEFLLDNERSKEAMQLLEDALEDLKYAPWSARWRNRRWSRRAYQLLIEADKAGEKQERTLAAPDPAEPNSTADRPGGS